MYAAGNCHSDVVALLLDRGAEVNEYSRWNRTPLMWATLRGCEETVRLLLNRGADASLKDRDGKTALMIATERNYAEIASLIRVACEGGKC
jgi:ankyrin repeat protein